MTTILTRANLGATGAFESRMLEPVRAAVRGLRHRRGAAVTIVLALTLGIGANSAIFSPVDAVLLKPLPFSDADRLVLGAPRGGGRSDAGVARGLTFVVRCSPFVVRVRRSAFGR